MIAVVGDIHGCYHTLIKLIEQLDRYFPGVPIYSVGDLVDRGNFSFEVIEYFIERNINFTLGNHEVMFSDNFRNSDSQFAYAWYFNGAEQTLKSYQNRFNKIDEHLNYINSMPLFFNNDDCFISHAGIAKKYDKLFKGDVIQNNFKISEILNQNLHKESGVLWCREKLANLGKLQVVGHTKMLEPKFDPANNSLYIDCGAVSGNKLVAAIIDNGKVYEYLWARTELIDIA